MEEKIGWRGRVKEKVGERRRDGRDRKIMRIRFREAKRQGDREG